ncbi:MAG: hypothetical protein KAX40_08985 [Herpetosiphon sp.]|nr:hypothetical protein [Herpetosiphon sp.]
MSLSILLVMILSLVACGGVSDTTIPTPSGTSEVKKGDDQITDLLIDSMNPALQQAAESEKGKVEKTTYYKTSASVADVKSFYETEMPKKGWKKIDINEASQPGMEFVGYESGNNGAFIFIIDNSQLGGSGTLLITSNVSK